MASEYTQSDVSAMVPAFWSARLQIPIQKSLVALETCNTDLASEISYGDTVHVPYIGKLTADTYTAGSAMDIQQFSATDDTISINQKKYVAFYIDKVEDLQSKPNYFATLADDAAYQLKDNIDAAVLGEVTAGIEFGESTASTGSYITGTATQTITATSGNIDSIFVDARKALREGNVTEAGDWIAILAPGVASKIELNAIGSGFNVADSTLRNGYAGDYLGFKIYVTNNLTASHAYIGKRGAIDLVMQKDITTQIRDVSDKLGTNFAFWCVYGYTVFTNNALRFLDVNVTV